MEIHTINQTFRQTYRFFNMCQNLFFDRSGSLKRNVEVGEDTQYQSKISQTFLIHCRPLTTLNFSQLIQGLVSPHHETKYDFRYTFPLESSYKIHIKFTSFDVFQFHQRNYKISKIDPKSHVTQELQRIEFSTTILSSDTNRFDEKGKVTARETGVFVESWQTPRF